MLRSLFGRGKRKRVSAENQDDSIRAALAGDVVTISGLGLEYEDRFFYIERRHRYSSGPDTWHELVCADGDDRVWVEWTEGYDLAVSATANPEPSGLNRVGLDEEDLIALDEEHSIDNFVTIDGKTTTTATAPKFSSTTTGAGRGSRSITGTS